MADSGQYQRKYWKELFELRVHVNYLEKYMGRSEFLDKTVNVFLAVTSSSSICAWAIWTKYSFVWGVIIATSQLVNAVKQFLPYRTRLKATGGILRELEPLLDSYEMRWFDVAEGKLSEKEINELQFEIRSKKTKVVQKHLGINTLPKRERLFREAKDAAEIYINNYYGA